MDQNYRLLESEILSFLTEFFVVSNTNFSFQMAKKNKNFLKIKKFRDFHFRFEINSQPIFDPTKVVVTNVCIINIQFKTIRMVTIGTNSLTVTFCGAELY